MGKGDLMIAVATCVKEDLVFLVFLWVKNVIAVHNRTTKNETDFCILSNIE